MCKRRKRIFRVSRSLACFRVFVFSCFRVFVRCDMRLGSTEPLNFDFLLDVTVILYGNFKGCIFNVLRNVLRNVLSWLKGRVAHAPIEPRAADGAAPPSDG